MSITGYSRGADKASTKTEKVQFHWKGSNMLLRSYSQAVNTLEGVFAFLRLPLALAPALLARGISRVGRCVGSLGVRSALNADSIVL